MTNINEYIDMSQFMTKLLKIKVKEGKEISKDLQNLFAVAFKNVLSAKRMAWYVKNC